MPLEFDPIAEAQRQWRRHRWGASDAMVAATSITRAHQIMMARIAEALAPLELTFARFETLALLHFSRAGELPLGKIGERLQVHAASVTNTIDRLEAQALVLRVPHPDDRRATLARLTADGRRRVEAASGALAAIDFGLAELNPTELDNLSHLITELRSRAGDF